jgi:hypothetical protein
MMIKGHILIAIKGYEVEDMRCIELNRPEGFWQGDVGWLVGDNAKDRPCGDPSKARRFKNYDDAVAYIYNKQKKHKKWIFNLLYEVDNRTQKVSTVDEILSIDAMIEAEKNENDQMRKECRDRDMPELEMLEAKYGWKNGVRLALLLGIIRNNGIDAAKQGSSTSTFQRLKKMLNDAGIKV